MNSRLSIGPPVAITCAVAAPNLPYAHRRNAGHITRGVGDSNSLPRPSHGPLAKWRMAGQRLTLLAPMTWTPANPTSARGEQHV